MTIKVSIRKIGYALALIGLSAPFAMPGLGHGKGARVVAMMKQAVTDPFSVLTARSPGQRDEARLVSTKQRHAPMRAAVPEEFVSPHAAVPAFFSAPGQGPADGPAPAFPPAADEIAPAFGKAPALPSQDGPGPRAHVGGWSVPIFPIGLGGIGGSGGGGPTPGDAGNPSRGTDTVPLPGVPEPSSWSMLVIGFLMVGASIRARAV